MNPQYLLQNISCIQRLFLAISALCLCIIFATNSSADSDEEAIRQSLNSDDSPALWSLSDSDSEIFLFGTMHRTPGYVNWQNSKTFKNAMVKATTTVLEFGFLSEESMKTVEKLKEKYSLNPEGVTLRDTLTKEQFTQLKQICQNLGIKIEDTDRLTLPGVAMALSSHWKTVNGYLQKHGADSIIRLEAALDADEMLFLDSDQLRVDLIESNLQSNQNLTFDSFASTFNDLADRHKNTYVAWLKGDLAELARQQSIRHQNTPDAFIDRIYVTRHKHWIENIEQYLSGKGTYFVAVGAFHFVGPHSILDMLRNRGHLIKRIE